MKSVKRQPTTDELISLSLGNILRALRYDNPNSKGVRVAYYGRFKDLKKDCMRIVNAIERMEDKDE